MFLIYFAYLMSVVLALPALVSRITLTSFSPTSTSTITSTSSSQQPETIPTSSASLISSTTLLPTTGTVASTAVSSTATVSTQSLEGSAKSTLIPVPRHPLGPFIPLPFATTPTELAPLATDDANLVVPAQTGVVGDLSAASLVVPAQTGVVGDLSAESTTTESTTSTIADNLSVAAQTGVARAVGGPVTNPTATSGAAATSSNAPPALSSDRTNSGSGASSSGGSEGWKDIYGVWIGGAVVIFVVPIIYIIFTFYEKRMWQADANNRATSVKEDDQVTTMNGQQLDTTANNLPVLDPMRDLDGELREILDLVVPTPPAPAPEDVRGPRPSIGQNTRTFLDRYRRPFR